jgi:uncharacterized protein (DUF2141 family)
MKHLIFLSLFFSLALNSTMAAASQVKTDSCKLVIHIQGFENSNGVAKVAICNSKESYDGSTPFRGINVKIINNQAKHTIKLPYGEYAVKVFHDENNNNELDTMMFGIPSEDYGFSNDARGSVGPPEYSQAAFILDSSKKKITIHIK